MLLMTRKAGDVIAIGDNIVIKVLDVQGGKVQLGIEAPRDIKVVAAPAATTSSEKKDPT